MMAEKIEPDLFNLPHHKIKKYPNKIRGLAKGIPVSVCTGQNHH